jgi:hypothetical protein
VAAAAAAAAGPTGSSSISSGTDQGLGQLSVKDGVSAIHAFVSFLLSLTHLDADGRIIVEPPGGPAAGGPAAAAAAAPDGQQHPSSSSSSSSSAPATQARGGRLRYVVLNAARHFGALLAAARSVLLVSGTLAPVEGLAAQLFPGLPASRLRHFACGHVVPRDHLLALAVGRGPRGRLLSLRHGERGSPAVVAELGLLLLNLAGVVPQGLVVFVPSFGYLDALSGAWQGRAWVACGGVRWRVVTVRAAARQQPRARCGRQLATHPTRWRWPRCPAGSRAPQPRWSKCCRPTLPPSVAAQATAAATASRSRSSSSSSTSCRRTLRPPPCTPLVLAAAAEAAAAAAVARSCCVLWAASCQRASTLVTAWAGALVSWACGCVDRRAPNCTQHMHACM